ncbi:MAG: tRNA (adenosine(37)-N6)-dimethylallyltransferase MiaA [Candidatus Dormibacteraeota bacterium]|uniref:tRNA dimethylallyltransferase n=1 Tax=Candidatus Aeolococcus gillhamiae TaxID=3127015 RepID=A0A2W5ZAF6_9BACT|nr:tRNA (adenosine(37)-N6)-dimethylallyltransferase MiaA [Candidatus Dormibacteraeota bacterium]PZR82370.1 MAG: tRNA (adenosine(37)-N6)-dimethylallyltransferase MiaA [Candidatus Dormibacter sp. RRmetagenome_bin12]
MSGQQPQSTVAIGGPTASGKTALAVELARRTGAELLNADSRQVVRRLVVGTARPSDAELGGVPCHLLDLCEPGEAFTVADWLRRARAVLDDLDARGVAAIVVGGTGQYLRALREGWRFGGGSPAAEQRDELTRVAATPAGLERLAVEMRERDPAGAATLDLANPRRVIRALELLRAGNGSLAAARGRGEGRRLDLVVLDAARDVHGEALAARMDAMFGAGAILAEVRAELDRGTAADAVCRAGIGYAEAVEVLEGRLNVDEAETAAVRRTSRYVKAQRTWFRHDAAVLRLERDRRTTTAALADAVSDATLTPGGSPR